MSSRSNRRMGDDHELVCLDMEIVINDTKYMITVFPDSDPDALAHEFAAQHELPDEMIGQLIESI